jgi:hypothetical protein
MSSNPATDSKADQDFDSADSGKVLHNPQLPRNKNSEEPAAGESKPTANATGHKTEKNDTEGTPTT